MWLDNKKAPEEWGEGGNKVEQFERIASGGGINYLDCGTRGYTFYTHPCLQEPFVNVL